MLPRPVHHDKAALDGLPGHLRGVVLVRQLEERIGRAVPDLLVDTDPGAARVELGAEARALVDLDEVLLVQAVDLLPGHSRPSGQLSAAWARTGARSSPVTQPAISDRPLHQMPSLATPRMPPSADDKVLPRATDLPRRDGSWGFLTSLLSFIFIGAHYLWWDAPLTDDLVAEWADCGITEIFVARETIATRPP